MKRFFQLYHLIENEAALTDLRSNFTDLKAQIVQIFKDLRAAVSQPTPDARQNAVSSLQGILNEPKAKPAVSPMNWWKSPVTKGTKEWHDFVNQLEQVLLEAEQGTPLLNSLAQAEQRVLQALDTLENKVITKLININTPTGHDPEKHQELLGKMGELGGHFGTLGSRLDALEKHLAEPAQPLTPEQEDKAYQAVPMLGGIAPMAGEYGLKLVHTKSNREVPLSNLNSAGGKTGLLNLASRDRRFKLIFNGGEAEFNLGDLESVTSAIDQFYEKNNINPDDWFEKNARYSGLLGKTRAQQPVQLAGDRVKKRQKGDAERQRAEADAAQAEIEAKLRQEREEELRRRMAAASGQPTKEHLSWKDYMLRLSGLHRENT